MHHGACWSMESPWEAIKMVVRSQAYHPGGCIGPGHEMACRIKFILVLAAKGQLGELV